MWSVRRTTERERQKQKTKGKMRDETRGKGMTADPTIRDREDREEGREGGRDRDGM